MSSTAAINSVSILQDLIRFNTSNPPGNEFECIMYIRQLLESVGIKTDIIAKDGKRPNLIARVRGKDRNPGLLLYGHVDVVPAHSGTWKYPPFSGVIAEGSVWGRGALDMKGGVAMMLSAVLRARAENVSLPGDLLLCFTSDEETEGSLGAGFLTEEYGSLFEGIRYGISEFGGFPAFIGNRKFYLIELQQKQLCRVRIEVKGSEGHASTIVDDNAFAKLGSVLTALSKKPLPLHITPLVVRMMKTFAQHVSFPFNLAISGLLNPLTNRLLLPLIDKDRAFFPFFHNIVNPTIVSGGESINVVPGSIGLKMDGRLLPGFTDRDLVREITKIIDDDSITPEVIHYCEMKSDIDWGLFPVLEKIMKELDPSGIPVPYLLPGSSDARFFSRLGIQTYGFIPMVLPENFNFRKKIHSSDECLPVSAVESGADGFFRLITQEL